MAETWDIKENYDALQHLFVSHDGQKKGKFSVWEIVAGVIVATHIQWSTYQIFFKRTYITVKHFLNTIMEEKGGSPYQFLYYGLKTADQTDFGWERTG